MPSDIDTFRMLRENVLRDISEAELRQELDRIETMKNRVDEYLSLVTYTLARQA